MKFFYVIALSFVLPVYMYCNNFFDITKKGYEQYQDIVINGKVVKSATNNHRDGKIRYKIIQSILNQYERPFTMLDIGASQGYYSFRTAYDYDCVCVMIEGNNPAYPLVGSQLFDLCKCNTELSNIILFNKKVETQDVQRLGECEHFDVVLAMNIIHWFGDNWKAITDAILSLGDNIIIETPPQEKVTDAKHNKQRKAIEDYLYAQGAEIIGKVKRHTSDTQSNIYLVQKHKNRLKRKTWIKPLEENPDKFIISSTFKEKSLNKEYDWPKNKRKVSNWVPGINLMTFKMYCGTYPLKKTIKENILALKDFKNNDWMPNNMVLQGSKIEMIDINDPTHSRGGSRGRRCTQKLLDNIFKMIDLDKAELVEDFFWKDLRRTPYD